MQFAPSPRRSAFTLIEILVVLAIIALLSALLFPAFARARENGRQSTCTSNLHQLYLATQQYYQDERAYPNSIVDLLPPGAPQAGFNLFGEHKVPDSAVGYYKAGNASLLCPNDNNKVDDPALPRSSYGALINSQMGATLFGNPHDYATARDSTVDLGRYMWNYWGYDTGGYAYPKGDVAAGRVGTADYKRLNINTIFATANPSLRTVSDMNLTPVFNAEAMTGYEESKRDNTIFFSLSNGRFAPPTTIITHCPYHRPNTAIGNIEYPSQLYANSNESRGARDIILRLDGTVRTLDVSNWFDPSPSASWANNPWTRQSLSARQ